MIINAVTGNLAIVVPRQVRLFLLIGVSSSNGRKVTTPSISPVHQVNQFQLSSVAGRIPEK